MALAIAATAVILVAMMAGYGIAAVFPVWLSVVAVLALELVCLWAIRDNLTLNVIMLLRPVEAIKAWQLEIALKPDHKPAACLEWTIQESKNQIYESTVGVLVMQK